MIAARSGAEALAWLRERADIAVVLLDLMMPVLGGLATAGRIRSELPAHEVPILLITAGDTPALEGYARGAVDVLRKPLDPAVLRAKVAVFVELYFAREQARRQAARLSLQEKAAKARNDALLNASIDAIVGIDHEGRITEFNHAAEVMFGFRREAVLGRAMAELIVPPAYREAHRRGVERYLATGKGHLTGTRIAVEAMRSDGSIFPVELGIGRVGDDTPPSFLGYIRDVTAERTAARERAELLDNARRAQAEAEAQRATLRTVFEQLPAPIAILRGPEHRYELSNPVNDALLAHRVVIGRPLRELFPELEAQGFTALLDQALATGEAVSLSETPYHWGTERRFGNVILAPLRGADGAPEGVLVFGADVTDQVLARRRVEALAEQLRASEDRLRLALDAGDLGTWDWDQLTGSLSWDERCCRLFGLSAGEHVDHESFLAMVHPDDTARVRELVQQALDPASGGGYEAEYRIARRDDGAERWMASRGRAFFDASGQPVRFLGIVADVTPVRQAEDARTFLANASQALASSLDYARTLERLASLAVPAVADSALVHQLELGGTVRLCAIATSDPARHALVRELESLQPRRLDQRDDLFGRVVHSGRAELMSEVSESLRESWCTTPRARAIVRELAVQSYVAVPLVVRGRTLGVLTSTTRSPRSLSSDELQLAEELARRAAMAAENAQLYQEAQEASRLKDEFLATISHELRTPLTAILGWTHLLRSGRPELVERALETIERNAQAQSRIVEDVLDVSRIIRGKLRLELQPLQLADVVRAAVESALPAARAKDIEIELFLDSVRAEVVGDPARLQQVVWNLLSNAIKFTREGGRVDVRLEEETRSVSLSVTDTGKGISREFLPRVFDRFQQADSAPSRAHGGLGLGLAIVRHLVELHGGQVSAESAGEERGATFTVTLPRHRARATDDAAPPARHGEASLATAGAPKLEGVRVLVVEDEEDTRDLLTVLLEREGAEVTTAPSSRVALDGLVERVPDVLVSDIGMPGEDGYALIRRVRALGAARRFWFPAVALTAYAHPQDRKRALSAGYQLHLPKPIEPGVLIDAVASLAGKVSADR